MRTLASLRRIVGAGLVLAAVCAPAGSAASEKAPGVPAPAVRVGSLVITVPRGFSRHDFRRRGRLVGVLITNYHVQPDSPTLTKGVFPPQGVALVLGLAALAKPTAHQIAAPPLRLPVPLAELHGPQRHADGDAWNGILRFRGSLYTISFWAGRTALADNRTALLHALNSIRRTP